ncbi:hypothetical protein ONZ45_g19624 [Pleurotus djamor]|nr:hypothetical protein ONZ45_g19624 [Pleurotus djamor]
MVDKYNAIAAQRPSNILALNHDTNQQSAQVVIPQAIQRLKQAGYRLVTVAECLGQQPYQSVGQPQVKDASWQC